MKKWQKILVWAIWAIAFVLACEITDYWFKHNLLTQWRVDAIEIAFLVLGAAVTYLPIKKKK